MEPPESQPEARARIPARSRRQAMDWSLVLASQEIHPVILPPSPESEEWSLLVEPPEFEPAMNAIRLYRLENRGWSWRKELPGGNLEIHSGAVLWCLLLAFWHWLAVYAWPALKWRGVMDSAAVLHGSWWRLFTPVMLHSDLAHLMGNLTFGVLILGVAMARFGPGITLLASYLCGALGNLFGILLYSHPYQGLGASGMMMGALGLLCIHSFGVWKRNPKAARYIISGVSAGFLIFILFGLSLKADILAHLGGFSGGLLFGALLSLFPERQLQSRLQNSIALALLFGLLIVTWSLALTR
jgi:membrane associated rhomboid family serine protease